MRYVLEWMHQVALALLGLRERQRNVARDVPSGRNIPGDLVEHRDMAGYTVEWRTYRDEDTWTVGIAVRVNDGVNGPLWLWGRNPLQRFHPLPTWDNYLVQSIETENLSDGPVVRELCRLQAAGLITAQERVMMQIDLMAQADAIEDAWAGM